MPDQIQLVIKSLKDFKNNLIILVPMLLSFGISFFFAIFVLLQVFLGALIFGSLSFDGAPSVGLMAYAAFFFFLDLIILFLMTSYITAAYYGTAADVVIKGKSSFKRLFQHGRTFLKPVLTFLLARFIVIAAPLALLGLFVFLAFMISSITGYITATISILLYIIFVLVFCVLTLFNSPMLVSRKLGGFRLLVESFRYGKSHFEHVIITLAVTIVLGIISTVIYSIFYLPSFIASTASEAMSGTGAALSLALVSFSLEVLASIASSICGIIILLYIFNSYFSRNPIKNWK